MSRDTAFEVLRSGSPTPLRLVSRFAERAHLDDRDRGLVRALVGCEVRRRGTLRAIVRLFAQGNPSPEVATILRLGVAQLCFMDSVPDHAAISETVRVASDHISLARGRYVNGVLRSVQRGRVEGHSGDPRQDLVGANWHFPMPIFRDPIEHPLLWAEDALSVPSNLFKRWHKRYGMETASELGRIALAEPDLSVVCLGDDREAILGLFPDLVARPGLHDKVALFDSSAASTLLHSPEFLAGAFTVQGETALRAAEAVAAQPGERILDLCAAPGGKTALLAKAGAQVLAADIAESRLESVKATLARLGLDSQVETLVSNGTEAIPADRDPFDAALVDAPCSNTGVLGARAGARWRFGPKTQKELIELQASLLDQASAWVRPGGRLVYSTCSLETDENEQQVRRFLETHSGWKLDYQQSYLPAAPGSQGPIDGGFHARLAHVGG
ncbi:MAG TPA: transcription antitermination factor NusB [Planctomycetota bacterium]|nr:methyltransferase domain-containing protein [Planctomycetota bacterium]HPF15484.1 transcription antitermination factor NusB [Planctomycetota bacterium]HRV81424.1 transcription antitermination factor NusB [Planctomycetota bacterium]